MSFSFTQAPEHLHRSFTWDHTGFTGIGGFLVSRVLNRVRKKMLDVGFPAVLDDRDEKGNLRPGSTLKPQP